MATRRPPAAASPEPPARERILGAAFRAFAEQGYAGASTLDIATRAHVSKRDLYANFGSKEAMLLACIDSRAERMRPPPDRPAPRDRAALAVALEAFAANLLREGSRAPVLAMFRLAIAEAKRAPEVAQALEERGRAVTRGALARLLSEAQAARLIGPGEPEERASLFLALIWQDLLLRLLLRVAPAPQPREIARRAETATAAFLRLFPAASGR